MSDEVKGPGDVMAEVWDQMVSEPDEVVGGEEEEKEELEGKEEVEPSEGEEEEVEIEASAEEGEEASEEEGDEGEQETGVSPGDLTPLEHWTRDDKAMFSQLPQDAQEFLIKRDKDFQSVSTRKMQEVADIRRALDPVREEMTYYGVSDGDAIRRLVGAHKMLQEKPREAIKFIMDTYQIDVDSLLSDDTSEDSRAMQEVTSVKRQMQQRARAEYEANVQAWDAEIEKFKGDHEFFDDVQGEMTRIVAGYQASGEQPPGLQELYDRACWAVPSVRKRLLDEESAEKEKERLEEAKKRAAKAKRATGTKVKTTTSASATKEEKPADIRGQLEAQFDKLSSGTL